MFCEPLCEPLCDGVCELCRELLCQVCRDGLCEVCVWGSWCDWLCSVGGTVRASHVQIALEFEEVNQTLLTGWLFGWLFG